MAYRTLSLKEVFATARDRGAPTYETKAGSSFVPLINPHVGYVALCAQGARDLLPDFVAANHYGLFVGVSQHLTKLIAQPDEASEALRVKYDRADGDWEPEKAARTLDPYVLDLLLRNFVDQSLVMSPEQLRDYLANTARREPSEAFAYAQKVYGAASNLAPDGIFPGGRPNDASSSFVNLRSLEPGCILA